MTDVRGIQSDAVTAWMTAHIEGVKAPLSFSIIQGGHSNLTYRVEDAAGTLYVLRRPPIGKLLATAHDMAREHRIISALAPTDVPVPPALGLCGDDEVNDAPFYVMGFVEGVVLDSAERTEEHFPFDVRRGIGESVIEVLASLHTVDLESVGLDTLAKKEDYIARQLKRWRTQWEKPRRRASFPKWKKSYERPAERHKPEQKYTAAVVHGDYRLGNMLSDARRVAWRRCSTGNCARSAIRWPTSAT